MQCHDDPWTLIPYKEAMKHGSSMLCIGLAAFFIASSPPAFAGIFGASKDDVAMKVGELSEQDHHALVRGLDFSPDGSRLAIDAESPTINIWDWRNKHVERTLQKPEGGNDFNASNPLMLSPDGRLLANCEQFSTDHVVARIWDTRTGSVQRDIIGGPKPTDPGGCTAAAFSANGQLLFLASELNGSPGHNVNVYETGHFEPAWGLSIDPNFAPKSLAASPDGEWLAVAGSHSVWTQGSITNELNIYIANVQQQKVVKVIPTDAMGPLAWSADGKRIAIAGEEVVETFDTQTGQNLVHEKLPESAHMNIRFTPDGRHFIESDMNGRGTGLGVKIWDGQHQTLLQEIPGNIGSIAVSRDSKYLAVGLTGRTVIWQFK